MKKVVLFLVLAFLGIGSTWAQSLPFRDSGSRLGKIIQVEVTGNDNVPVKFIKNTHQIFTVRFVVNQDILNYKFKAFAILNGVPIPIPGVQPVGLKPPFNGGSECFYLVRFDTENTAPKITFTLRLILESEKGEVIVSFDIAVKVVNK